ncbi:MAG: ABC transporter substrate-binding protein [Hyphomicrobiaceae bacterium]
MLIAVGVCLAILSTATGARAADPPSRLVVATSSPIDTLDPHLTLDTRRAGVRRELYDGLFRWQNGPLRVAPWLAQSYTVSEDGRVFRFTLRKEARFHDGREVRASDVVYSVERVLALKRGLAPVFAGLVSPGATKAIDSHVVEFSLSRASPLFLALLPELAIVNADLLKANEINNDWGRGWLQSNDAGSGSYAFKQRSSTGAIVAARFAGHWNADWPAKPVEEVEWRPMIDPEARISALLDGKAHVIAGDYLPDQFRRLRQAKDVSLLTSETPRVFLGLLHAGREPMKTAAFRKILAQAFDTARFIATSMEEGAAPLAFPVPPSLATPPPSLARPRYDIDAAIEALAKLKTPPKELTIGAIAGDPQSERAAVVMLDGLVKLGLPARIVSEPWPVVASRMGDEKQMYDILFLWRGARYRDANNWLGEMFDCDLFGAGNASWYCNRDADRLVKEARGASDARTRRQGFEKAAAILAEDQAALFVATAKRHVPYARSVKGLQISPVGETIDLRSATISPPVAQ